MKKLVFLVSCSFSLLPTVKVSIPSHYNVVSGGGFGNVPDAVISPGIKTKTAATGTSDVSTGITTCPVLSLEAFDRSGTVVQTNPYFITPLFFTFSTGRPVRVNLTAVGENFNEFYLQAKDLDEETTIGQWRILDEQSDSYQCNKDAPTKQYDTVYWKNSGETKRYLVAEWSIPESSNVKPNNVVLIGSFKSSSNEYQTSYSKLLYSRPSISLEECCKKEVSNDCQRMCSSRNLEDALSSALENCKLEMYKLQWCFLTERSSKVKVIALADEKQIMANNNEKRSSCCSKDSVNGECLGMCSAEDIFSWATLYPNCKGVGRQIYSCWSKTSCVKRCADGQRSDFPCQCDVGCEDRGDCCGDKDLTCYIKLPVKMDYWPTSSISCSSMPLFAQYKVPKLSKEISDIKIDTDANPLKGLPESPFVMRMTTFMEVKTDGAYRFYILLGKSDMAMIKIDSKYMAMIKCNDNGTPTTFDALLPMGGHQITIEYANAGFSNKLRVAYQGPDTGMKPKPISPLDHSEVSEMGLPAELNKSAKTLTKPVTATRAAIPQPQPAFTPRPPFNPHQPVGDIFAKTTPRPSDVRSPIPRAPWANPNPIPQQRVPPPTRPPTTSAITTATTKPPTVNPQMQTEPVVAKKISNKVIIGTVFGVMSGIIAAGIIFKFL